MFRDNLYKDKVREIVFSRGPRKGVLLLPGEDALCVRKGVLRGVITKATRLTACEKEADIFYRMSHSVRSALPPGARKPDLRHCPLHELEVPPRTDMAWIDLCGNLTLADCYWVRDRLIPKLAEGADVSFTLRVNWRSNDVMRDATAACKPFAQEFSALSKQMGLRGCEDVVASHVLLLRYLFSGHRFTLQSVPYRSMDEDRKGRNHFITYGLLGIRRDGSKAPKEAKEALSPLFAA